MRKRDGSREVGLSLIRVAVAIVVFLATLAAQAEKRVALVIGNSAYQTAPALPNPVRDAEAVAAALHEAGFADVTEGYDLTKAKFDEALKRFGDAAADADWALIFYAGHGIGIGGETYVLPVDAVLKRAEHADDEAIPLSCLRSKASGAKALRMVILDSCRENPFAARFPAGRGAKRGISRGLPAPEKPEGDELIAYATRENEVAEDGEGEHSPFTSAFLRHLSEPALEVRFVFGKVRDSVQAATDRQQTPTTYGDLGGTFFYFRPPKSNEEAIARTAPEPAVTKPAVKEPKPAPAARHEEASLAPAKPTPTCNMRSGTGERFSGRVLSFVSAEEAAAMIQFTQKKINGTISPDYVRQRRVRLEALQGGLRPVVLVPDRMTVHPGDLVEYIDGHPAPGLPCHYIPNVISRVLTSAARN
jgi:hypothetical protein